MLHTNEGVDADSYRRPWELDWVMTVIIHPYWTCLWFSYYSDSLFNFQEEGFFFVSKLYLVLTFLLFRSTNPFSVWVKFFYLPYLLQRIPTCMCRLYKQQDFLRVAMVEFSAIIAHLWQYQQQDLEEEGREGNVQWGREWSVKGFGFQDNVDDD